jgi:amino-acid N-acetyltransferase
MSGSGTELFPRPACPGDLSSILGLLSSFGLPTAGVAENLGHFLVAEEEGRVVACAGFEPYGRLGLLRSLAVEGAAGGRGLGGALAGAIEEKMARSGLAEAYLLTTGAEEFWERRGYEAIDRRLAPEGLRSSEELKGACPCSATLMRKNLEGKND